jgi:adenosine/AMP kinase
MRVVSLDGNRPWQPWGVVDGFSQKGVEDDGEIKWRKDVLRQIGYKL